MRVLDLKPDDLSPHPTKAQVERALSDGRFDRAWVCHTSGHSVRNPDRSQDEVMNHQPHTMSADTQYFERQVRDRRVLLLGHGVDLNLAVRDVSDFDTLVCIKSSEPVGGRQPDIVYTAATKAGLLDGPDCVSRAELLSRMSPDGLIVYRNQYEHNSDRCRRISAKPRLVFGSVQLGQWATVDLLRFAPRALTLRGFDFYLSSTTRDPKAGDLAGVVGGNERIYRNLARHDILSNRELLKWLYHQGIIEIGPETVQALQGTDHDFMHRLETGLGTWGT
jgi:hypothetical protein